MRGYDVLLSIVLFCFYVVLCLFCFVCCLVVLFWVGMEWMRMMY